MTRTWVPLAGDIWAFSTSEILNEQASEEHAHPLMTTDQPPHWWASPRNLWTFAASTILKEQACEDEAEKIASSEVLSY